MDVAAEGLDGLRSRLRGELLTSGDGGYDNARRVWNEVIDKHPAFVVRCRGTADVMAAVNHARENGLQVAVRGGGHHVAGRATTDGGVMLDLSSMDSVSAAPDGRRVRVEPGAVARDVDHETQAFGLATPLGIVFAHRGGGRRSRRRHRIFVAFPWPDGRQPDLRRDGDGRRGAGPGKRGRKSRSSLGTPGWRRQSGCGDLLRVPPTHTATLPTAF